MGCRRALAEQRTGDPRLPDADRDHRLREDRRPPGSGPERPEGVSAAQTFERSTTLPANRHSPTNKGTTPQRRSVPTGAGYGRWASHLAEIGEPTLRKRITAERATAHLTYAAPAARSKATRSEGLPPRRPEGFVALEHSGKATMPGGIAPGYKPSRQRGGLPRSGDSKSELARPAELLAFDGGTTQHGSGGRRAEASPPA